MSTSDIHNALHQESMKALLVTAVRLPTQRSGYQPSPSWLEVRICISHDPEDKYIQVWVPCAACGVVGYGSAIIQRRTGNCCSTAEEGRQYWVIGLLIRIGQEPMQRK
ncbi:predicted protein [Histoplasma capsulatum H143]|uniref:Uncharacterized protein n=1 Tax=Ajellomyces capsulatus (strain H143) TaxID=544712 RepID=C6H551_AJECH|nr:predicted protein [Histoplasma capsulatum H143]